MPDHVIVIPEDIESGNLDDLSRVIKEVYHGFMCAYDAQTGVSLKSQQYIHLAFSNLTAARANFELAELEQAAALGGR